MTDDIECQKLCQAEPTCEVFVWRDDGRCHLVQLPEPGKVKTQADDRLISGLKYCPDHAWTTSSTETTTIGKDCSVNQVTLY